IFMLGLSATILSNSVTEIIDVIRLATGKTVTRSMLFTTAAGDGSGGNSSGILRLKPGALDLIKNLLRGRISYYYNLKSEHYPEIKFEGTHIAGISFTDLDMKNVYDMKF